MSGSVKTRLLVEICVAWARFSAKKVPTILLLDGIASLDHDSFDDLMNFLSTPENNFQTILTRVYEPRDPCTKWGGWEYVRLVGTCGAVRIDQTPL